MRGRDRADVGVAVERVTNSKRRDPILQQCAEVVEHRLGHEDPLIGTQTLDDSVHGLIQRCVVVDDVHGLPDRLRGDASTEGSAPGSVTAGVG